MDMFSATRKLSAVAQWQSVRLTEIEGSQIPDSSEALCFVPLSKTLYPLLCTGSTQEDRKNVLTCLKNC